MRWLGGIAVHRDTRQQPVGASVLALKRRPARCNWWSRLKARAAIRGSGGPASITSPGAPDCPSNWPTSTRRHAAAAWGRWSIRATTSMPTSPASAPSTRPSAAATQTSSTPADTARRSRACAAWRRASRPAMRSRLGPSCPDRSLRPGNRPADDAWFVISTTPVCAPRLPHSLARLIGNPRIRRFRTSLSPCAVEQDRFANCRRTRGSACAGQHRHRTARWRRHRPVHRALPQGGHRRPRRHPAARIGNPSHLPARTRRPPRRSSQEHRRTGQIERRIARRD